MANRKSQIANRKQGFTLIELIIYLAIVSIILVSLTYLILDIIGGQTYSNADVEVNQNLRFISNSLIKDIRSAQDIDSLSSDNLVLTMSGDDITYNFAVSNQELTRQVGSDSPITWHSDEIEVTGSFTDLSYASRAKSVGVDLFFNYKNPSNLPDFNASSSASFAAELRGRK